ncbi:MAG: hypothetical protein GY757_55695 [bacterium]|nr:hypothetical protein [bacterium]
MEYIDDFLEYYEAEHVQDALNFTFTAPHSFAIENELSFLVIIDEIQYMTQYIYWDKERKIKAHNLPGMFHGLSESKVAPMLVSGSYIGWMVQMIQKMFVGGRLKRTMFKSQLEERAGLEAVYRYADYYQVTITDESALILNVLSQSDPFYVATIIKSDWEFRDFSTIEGTIKTIEHEILNENGEIFGAWSEYILNTVDQVNDKFAKKILLYLSKERYQEHTRTEISAHLDDQLPESDLEEKLKTLLYGDLITRGSSAYRYCGIKDNILDLIFRLLYQEEIDLVEPDIGKELTAVIDELKKENRSLAGAYWELKGRLLEVIVFRELNKLSKAHQPIPNLLNRLRPRLIKDQAEIATTQIKEMSQYIFETVWINYQLQHPSQSPVEFDVLADGSEGGRHWAILFEIKHRDHKHLPTLKEAKTFAQKVSRYKEIHTSSKEQVESANRTFTIFPIYLSANGFTPEVEQWLQESGIHTADFDTWLPA